MPPALLNKPELDPGLSLYLEAFWDLTPDRPLGVMGGVGQIPFGALDRYASREGLEGEEFERFRVILKALDSEYLKHVNKKTGKGEGKKP